MSKRYGIVYLGSKEKILDLIQYMFDREYKKEYMIDLFAGGFAVSSYALQKGNFKVIANDLNKYIIALYEELLNGGKNFEKIKYDWISREKFEHVYKHPERYENWYVGYVLNTWSFGCNQKDYLYGREIEDNKKTLHQALVHKDYKLLKEKKIMKDFVVPFSIRKASYKKHKDCRVIFMSAFKRYIKTKKLSSGYSDLQKLKQLEHLQQTEHLNAIKRNIKHKGKLKLFSMDWRALYELLPNSVLENSFIYCDPPYEDAKQYLVGEDLNYSEFWDWFRNCDYPVYVSSYKAPEDIEPIHFHYKLQLLDNGKLGDNKPKKSVRENLYWNGKGEPEPTFADLLFNGDE